MNGAQPKIEIFEPFGAAAYEMMKGILLQPFDFAKWCVLGFAAFLSGAWGNNFRFRFPLRGGDWNFKSTSYHNASLSGSLPPWAIPLVVAVAVLALVVAVVIMWVVSRGRFIFIDCVARNRAAIVVPWREYRREGNSFFLFFLAVTALVIVLAAVSVLLVLIPMGLRGGRWTAELNATAVFVLIFVGLVWLALSVFFAVVSQSMVPVMYRRRCLAREAFFDVSKLVLARPGPFVLFVLFGIVLLMALVVVSTIVSCLTCCIAGLPYVSSVVLLPAFVWLLAFKLLFLRQFGPEYDVWASANLSPPALPIAPSDVPPPPTE